MENRNLDLKLEEGRRSRPKPKLWLWLSLLAALLAFGWLRIKQIKQTTDAKPLRQKLDFHYGNNVVKFSPDGKFFVVGRGLYPTDVSIWRRDTSEVSHIIKAGHDHGIGLLAISPDSKTLVTSSVEDDSRLFLWAMESGRKSGALASTHSLRNSLLFSPDGRLLVSAGRDHKATVEAWNPQSEQLLYTVTESAEGAVFAFPLPDNRRLLTLSKEGLKLRDLQTGKLLRQVSASIQTEIGLSKAALSSDGKTLALLKRFGQSGVGFIELWDVSGGKLLRTLSRRSGTRTGDHLWTLAFSPDGKLLADSASEADGIRLSEVSTGKVLHMLTPTAVSLAFSPDGKTLAAGAGREVYLWNLEVLKAQE